eukprot:750706-Pyramimonas_sp.AAC.1
MKSCCVYDTAGAATSNQTKAKHQIIINASPPSKRKLPHRGVKQTKGIQRRVNKHEKLHKPILHWVTPLGNAPMERAPDFTKL